MTKKLIRVKVMFNLTCPALPENYDGETEINKMIEMEKKQFEDREILLELILQSTPKIEITAEEI